MSYDDILLQPQDGVLCTDCMYIHTFRKEHDVASSMYTGRPTFENENTLKLGVSHTVYWSQVSPICTILTIKTELVDHMEGVCSNSLQLWRYGTWLAR